MGQIPVIPGKLRTLLKSVSNTRHFLLKSFEYFYIISGMEWMTKMTKDQRIKMKAGQWYLGSLPHPLHLQKRWKRRIQSLENQDDPSYVPSWSTTYTNLSQDTHCKLKNFWFCFPIYILIFSTNLKSQGLCSSNTSTIEQYLHVEDHIMQEIVQTRNIFGTGTLIN